MLIARSSPECHLYMELHPCACGETRAPADHRLESGADGLVAVYGGACPRCGSLRRFEFALDPEIPPADKFGGKSPSKVIDAGQFLDVADQAAKAVPGNTAALDADGRHHAASLMARAVAALEEILKFIPEGADRVAPEALFTDLGRAVYDREPGRFRKPRLEAVLGVYRDSHGKLRQG